MRKTRKVSGITIGREHRIGPFFESGVGIEFESAFHRFLGVMLAPGVREGSIASTAQVDKRDPVDLSSR
ncbi:hypothetical protein CK228_25250 [Mesorhizobium sp. WSM4312]|nr:hypothetical protein CK228_25250 [Mesorhizobium sp. WSM4312]PBC18687.1 hypothetical protein CK226_33560 [Mesorhizobium sp. WSM4311]